ncbi:MAG: hypothetical protein PWR20_49 [Bacteroidales bacterium]|jgi:hypothetical protein|nr:hypothetical protein [Bacteroidales bacterium]MDN5328624.1 hypothetical protein [Bacteroidales bacterium]
MTFACASKFITLTNFLRDYTYEINFKYQIPGGYR